ncbi:lytic polysaccharide monooxygenase [Nemania sp. FL0031]|nr:lytic polysaccharide monooxygenase [Nemania sp. FL0031]
MQFTTTLMAMLAAGSAMAHMNMNNPPPLAYKGNKNTQQANIDYSITSPITAAQYPCKGYLKFLGTPDGAAVATYSPGQTTTMSVEGGAFHNGGSCQLSLSYDKGTTFTVIKSFIGSCPTSSGGTFSFTIPSDAPEGDDVVFAWTWVNKTGNREFYMSCAVVNIKSGGAKRAITNEKRAVAFADRPQVFQANIGGTYCTKEGVDTVFPDPGPDVENNAVSPGPAVLCATGADAPAGDAGSGSSGSGGAASSSSAPSSSAAADPVPSSAADVTPTGGVFLTTGGLATPTTLATATSVSAPATSSAAASSEPASSSVPVATPTTSASQPAPTGGAAGTQTGACTNEGAWNCIDGTSFQRCASGQWSVAMSMAAGTQCTPGESDTLSMSRRRHRIRRGHHKW